MSSARSLLPRRRRATALLTLSGVTLSGAVALATAETAHAVSSNLSPGQGLVAGQHLASPNGAVIGAMQTDGNFVFYAGGRAIWSTNTNGNPGARLAFQTDGNLVVYSAAGQALWNTGTYGKSANLFAVQDDGNGVVYAPGVALWNHGSYFTTLLAGNTLRPGQYLTSPSRKSSLVMQGDGNLVAYRGTTAQWSSGTNGVAGAYAVMQTDGNFVVYAGGAAKWASGSSGSAANRVMIHDSGAAIGSDANIDVAKFATAADCTMYANAVPKNVPITGTVRAEGLRVNTCFAANTMAMVRAARASGVTLTGGGYRSRDQQIQTRINNCGGSSHYNIYEKPSGDCNPPTAKPGTSQHEAGLAIDFNMSSGVGAWLRANAGRYHYVNFPVEPWHWSWNGR